ncbi:MAG: VCBS repeat-containing protein [Verrucomicrobiota bacterium]|nr:VCBS repeat-containing protein [Verrucomicrobiota bacterium]
MKPCLLSLLFLSPLLSFAGDSSPSKFERKQLTDEFWSEGAHIGDFNKDGKNDIVSGPFWYEGPAFTSRHEYMPLPVTTYKTKEGQEKAGYDPHGYSKNFLAYTYDINQDGWTDILILGFPGEESSWYANPQGKPGHWEKHVFLKITDNESPTFTDITGDGKPEVICNSEGYFGYAEPDWSDPRKLWTFKRISPKGPWQRFTHGLGVGDVNGDGKMDLLEVGGWWEQPASLDGNPEWKKHNHQFGIGGAQMYAYDFDGDGDNDILTSLAAHGFGLAWYEQVKEGDTIRFKEHIFMNKEPQENKYGVKFSQLHAIDLVDMDGDGIKDIITGKRYWAHGPTGDAEPNAEPVLYWFQTKRGGPEKVDFVPHQIDNNSGIGTQVLAADVNGDKRPDVVVGNKRGTFLFLRAKQD